MALAYGGALFSPLLVVPLLASRLRRRWERQDLGDGFAIQPKALPLRQRIFGTVLVGVLVLVAIVGWVQGIFGYTVISDSGIQEFAFGRYRVVPLREIASVWFLPDGMTVPESSRRGPMTEIMLTSGRSITWSESEFESAVHMKEVQQFLAGKAGRLPELRPGAMRSVTP